MNRSTKAMSVLGAIALTISLSACGDDDGDTTASSDNSPASSETSAGDDADAGDDQSEEGGDANSDVSAYCDAFVALAEDESLDMGNITEEPDAAASIVEVLSPLADSAPEEVKADWDAVMTALETIAEIDLSDPEAMNDPAVMEKLNGISDLETNFMNIGQHGAEACDVDLNYSDSGTGASQS